MRNVAVTCVVVFCCLAALSYLPARAGGEESIQKGFESAMLAAYQAKGSAVEAFWANAKKAGGSNNFAEATNWTNLALRSEVLLKIWRFEGGNVLVGQSQRSEAEALAERILAEPEMSEGTREAIRRYIGVNK